MPVLLLNFDVEEFDRPLTHKVKVSEERLYSISVDGTEKILKLLDEYNVKSTFFATTSFALKKPKIIEEIISRDHEVASHGLKHSLNYATISHQDALESLKEAKTKIEGKFNIKVAGFRAPRMRPPLFEVIRDAGFSYDSSIHPTFVPGRYNNILKPRRIHKVDGLFEVPVSTTPVLGLPYSWVWFRCFGLSYAKLCTTLTLARQDFVNILFHPWEFVDLSSEFKGRLPWFITKNTGKKMEEMLGEYLAWCRSKNVETITIKDYLTVRIR